MTKGTLKASAAALYLVRSRMSNQERIDNPLTEEQAMCLFLEETVPLDTRRLCAHKLLDIAYAEGRRGLLRAVCKALKVKHAELQVAGILARVAADDLGTGFGNWAFVRLKKLGKLDMIKSVREMNRRQARQSQPEPIVSEPTPEIVQIDAPKRKVRRKKAAKPADEPTTTLLAA